jgi:hypothetical protein
MAGLVQDKAAGFFRPPRKDHGIFDRLSASTSRIENIRERSIGLKDAVSGWTRVSLINDNSRADHVHQDADGIPPGQTVDKQSA